MKSSVSNQTAELTKNKSIVFKLWCQLLAKRKKHISIRILCIFLITIATVVTWIIQLSLQCIALMAEAALEDSSDSDTEPAAPIRRGDDPFGDFSMSLNGYD